MSGLSLRALELRRPGSPGFTLRVGRWDLAPGARVALCGPSGSGKSTLLAAISGELQVSGGELHALGVPLHRLDAQDRAAFRLARVGMVLQEDTLIPWLSVRDNVLLPYRLGPALPRDPSAGPRADALLRELGMPDRGGALPSRLSAGERQRVSVARALITAPPLLLADEPTSALDAERATAVLQAIDRLCEARGTTAIVVTHDPDLAGAMAQTVQLADLLEAGACA